MAGAWPDQPPAGPSRYTKADLPIPFEGTCICCEHAHFIAASSSAHQPAQAAAARLLRREAKAAVQQRHAVRRAEQHVNRPLHHEGVEVASVEGDRHLRWWMAGMRHRGREAG